MISKTIFLKGMDDVKDVVAAATKMPFDIDMVSGVYIVDAKSLLGIISLDFSKPIRVDIFATEEQAQPFLSHLAKYAAS